MTDTIREAAQQVELPALPDEREAFEAWIGPRGYTLHRDCAQGYLVYSANIMWEAWQARAALAAQADETASLRHEIKVMREMTANLASADKAIEKARHLVTAQAAKPAVQAVDDAELDRLRAQAVPAPSPLTDEQIAAALAAWFGTESSMEVRMRAAIDAVTAKEQP